MIPTHGAIINSAIETYQPSHIFVLVSGGGDSSLTADKTFKHLDSISYSGPRSVVSLNTLLFADGWADFLRKYVKDSGWEHDPKKLFYTNPNPDFYESWVMRFGFPYTPRGHLTMQNRLKLRAVTQLVRENKTQVGNRNKRFDKIMLVTGFRKFESHSRMSATEPIQVIGSQLWVNPIFYYQDEQKNTELFKLGLLANPYKEAWGVSGDCGCGAYAGRGELDKVNKAFPCLGRRLCDLSCKVKNRHGWGWDEQPPEHIKQLLAIKGKVKAQVRGGQKILSLDMFSPLCAGCRQVKQGYGKSLESRLLQQMDW